MELTAGRLHLRPWEPRDAAEVAEICQDPAIQRWTRVPVPYRREDAEAFVGEVSPKGWAAGTDALFAVLDATTGAVLASVGLMGIADGAAEVGYWTAPVARRQGVTAQAVGVACRWAFAELGLQRVLWQAEVGNDGSRAVAEAAGFTVEGTQRLGLLSRGRRVDCWTGSLLATDEVRDRRAFGSWRDLSGEGLLLRQWREDDLDALVAGSADPETARWVPVPVPFTEEDGRAALGRYARAWADGSVATLAVEEDGQVVGLGVLILLDDVHAELGWWTSPHARGRGVAPRTARLLRQWAGRLGRRGVQAWVDVDDVASQRAADRSGLARVGVVPAGMRPLRGGPARDAVLYAAATG